jgi:hypothetical protein
VDELRRVEKRVVVGDPTKGQLDPALDVDQAAIRREAQPAEHMVVGAGLMSR